MIYLALLILGLSLGSFINALVWRLYKQNEIHERQPANAKKQLQKLSIVHGRSMCVHCKHELAPKDLVPVFSWLYLRGKCRYCKKPINDTPVAELVLPALFILSYLVWPYADLGWGAAGIGLFVLWLLALTCFVALAIYDAKWFILPDRVVLPLTVIAVLIVGLRAVLIGDPISVLWSAAGAAVISGLFWFMSFVSRGTWIGWGDVKLGIGLGLLAGSPLMALLVVFIASLFGAILMLPQILSGKQGLKSSLPFGPHLIAATIAVFFWGEALYNWYFGLFIG